MRKEGLAEWMLTGRIEGEKEGHFWEVRRNGIRMSDILHLTRDSGKWSIMIASVLRQTSWVVLRRAHGGILKSAVKGRN